MFGSKRCFILHFSKNKQLSIKKYSITLNFAPQTFAFFSFFWEVLFHREKQNSFFVDFGWKGETPPLSPSGVMSAVKISIILTLGIFHFTLWSLCKQWEFIWTQVFHTLKLNFSQRLNLFILPLKTWYFYVFICIEIAVFY